MRRLFLCLSSGLALFSVWFYFTRTPFPSEPAREAVADDSILVATTDSDLPTYELFVNDSNSANVQFFPSAGREASDFNELTDKLKNSGYSTIAVQPHGIGFSEPLLRPSLAGFSRPLELGSDSKPTVLIGHAFGNRVVRYAAHQNPDNVKAVILLAAGGQVPMEPKAEQSLRDIFNPMKSHKARMEDVRYAFFAEGNDIPDHWTRGWHTKTAIAQGKAVAVSAGDDSWHCAGGVPMLIVQPMQDRIAPIENAYALRDKCPQEVEIVEVENAGHALLPEQPEAVAEAVLAFLAKHHPVE